MQKSYFHNYKFANENINKKNPSKSIYLNRKISVDINQLLNRVRINKKTIINYFIIFFNLLIFIEGLRGKIFLPEIFLTFLLVCFAKL